MPGKGGGRKTSIAKTSPYSLLYSSLHHPPPSASPSAYTATPLPHLPLMPTFPPTATSHPLSSYSLVPSVLYLSLCRAVVVPEAAVGAPFRVLALPGAWTSLCALCLAFAGCLAWSMNRVRSVLCVRDSRAGLQVAFSPCEIDSQVVAFSRRGRISVGFGAHWLICNRRQKDVFCFLLHHATHSPGLGACAGGWRPSIARAGRRARSACGSRCGRGFLRRARRPRRVR